MFMPPVPPKFDRVAVSSLRIFDSVPRVGEKPNAVLYGFPVVVDDEVAPGVIELRNGDDVIMTVYVGAGELTGTDRA